MERLRKSWSFGVLLMAAMLLMGCPNDPQAASQAGSGKGPDKKDQNGPVTPSEGFDGDWSALLKRRFFIRGVEVYYDKALEGPAAPKVYGPRPASADDGSGSHGLRMLVSDLTSDQQREGLGRLHDFLKHLFAKLFWFGPGHYEVSKILVDVLDVQVLPEGATEWKTVVDFGTTGKRLDLLALANGSLLEIGTFALPPGRYESMRMNLGNHNEIEVDEGQGPVVKPLETPSNDHERIDFHSSFEIASEGLTTMKIDFDVAKSIKRRGNGTYFLKPNMKILGVETKATISKTMTVEAGGVLGVFGDVMISIPPGALSEDTEITLVPVRRLTPHETLGVMMMGMEYIIEPSGLVLNEPMQVSMPYQSLYAPILGLDPETIDVYRFDEVSDRWQVQTGAPTREAGTITRDLEQLGRIAVGGSVVADRAVSGPGCSGYDREVQVGNTDHGLDLQYFAAACNRQDQCYQHGFRTYRKDASACDEELAARAKDRCEDICLYSPEFGKSCSALTAEERAAAEADGLTLALYETCQTLKTNLAEEAKRLAAERYPDPEASTCLDYEGLGVSCEPATCVLTVDKSSIRAGTPTDLTFNLHLAGSVYEATFDGSIAYQQDGVATPIAQDVVIAENARVLGEARTFTAVVTGPGSSAAQPATCSVTVSVIKDPEPCTLSISPATIRVGEISSLFLIAGPGYDTAFVDLREAGRFGQVGLQPPSEDGTRRFASSVRPPESRVYQAKVRNAQGVEKTCSASITVNP